MNESMNQWTNDMAVLFEIPQTQLRSTDSNTACKSNLKLTLFLVQAFVTPNNFICALLVRHNSYVDFCVKIISWNVIFNFRDCRKYRSSSLFDSYCTCLWQSELCINRKSSFRRTNVRSVTIYFRLFCHLQQWLHVSDWASLRLPESIENHVRLLS